jgi:hypothetical protein
MTNKQIFIAILIISLLFLNTYCKCNNESENFELNLARSTSMSCDNQPLNSNCFCESEKTKQKVTEKIKEFRSTKDNSKPET